MKVKSSAQVGVTIFLMSKKYVLLAKRKGGIGSGRWDTPGGHLEYGETIGECASRELLEEAGLKIKKNSFKELGITEDFFIKNKRHYISCVLLVKVNKSTLIPARKEREKFSTEWIWFKKNALPSPLFLPVKNALKKFSHLL